MCIVNAECCVSLLVGVCAVAQDSLHSGDRWISGEASRGSECEVHSAADARLPGNNYTAVCVCVSVCVCVYALCFLCLCVHMCLNVCVCMCVDGFVCVCVVHSMCVCTLCVCTVK